MNKDKFKGFQWRRRKKRVRKKVSGDAEQPRLTVYRSLRHTYAQLVDDDNGSTLVEASTMGRKIRDELPNGGNVEAAAKIGEAVARRALAIGIKCVRFDRNGYKYHGRVRALAEAARKAGLVF